VSGQLCALTSSLPHERSLWVSSRISGCGGKEKS